MTLPAATSLNPSLLRIDGNDALRFAQAQFTSNVCALQPQSWQWSAWLDAHGRVQNLFHLLRIEEQQLLLVLRGGDASVLAERLRRYVLRDKVRLTTLASTTMADSEAMPLYTTRRNNDTLQLGLGDRSLQLPAVPAATMEWRAQAIRDGEPWLVDALAGTFLPPALGLRRLGALSFDKGCFPGQEIAARLHYRGGHKHVLLHLRLFETVAPGSVVVVGNTANANGNGNGNDASLSVLDCVNTDALVVAHARTQAMLPDSGEPTARCPRLVRAFSA